MDYTTPKENYDGCLAEVILGTGDRAIRVGGDDAYPFHYFEGRLPNPPKFAVEVYDLEPNDWPEAVFEPFSDVAGDPAGWAAKCVDVHGAEALALHLVSTDPVNTDASPESAAATVKAVCDAVDVPLIVYGTGNEKKDALVMTRVAEACAGKNLFLGPVQPKNIEEMARAARANGHGVVLKTPLEHGLAREVNIRLKEYLTAEKILCDPTSMPAGYGIEFSFTVNQRFQQAAMLVDDTNMQMPLVAFIGKECWSVGEARKGKAQGIAWEAVSAMTLLLSGASLVVLRHPDTYQLLKKLTRRDSQTKEGT